MKGVFTDLLTPFNEKQEVQYNFFNSHLEFLKKNKIDGVICHGIFGEYPSLTPDERFKILDTVIQNKRGLKVFPFISNCCIYTLIELYKKIAHLDFDAVFVGLPFFYPLLNVDGLEQFLSLFFKEVKHPVILVNIPQYTGNKITIELVERLTVFPKFAGIADYLGDFGLSREIEKKFPQLQYLIAAENLFVDGLKNNASGLISHLANVFPKPIVDLYSTYYANRFKALEIQTKIKGLKGVLSKYPTRSSLKYAMLQQGFPKLSVRTPLRDLSEGEKTLMKSKLTSYLIEMRLLDD